MRVPHFVALAMLLVNFACAAERGHLLVIGGGLQPDNVRVFQRLSSLARPAAVLTIVPTASADPAAAVREIFTPLKKNAPAAAISALHDPGSEPSVALAQLRRSGGLFFTGGDQARIIRRFRPAGINTPERTVMIELLARGGVIGGTSAGAAMMSDPMFLGGESEAALGGVSSMEASSRGEGTSADSTAGPELGRGMGFFPYGLVDSHFFSRGRMGRLIAAQEAAGVRLGFGVADNRALEVDLTRARVTALGDRAALVIDVRELRRHGRSRLGVRVTLLSDGDQLDVRTGFVRLGGGRVFALARWAPAHHAAMQPDAWGAETLLACLDALAHSGHPSAAASHAFVVELSADQRTRFAFGRDGSLLTAVHVIANLIFRG